jgi:hypothetical protein
MKKLTRERVVPTILPQGLLTDLGNYRLGYAFFAKICTAPFVAVKENSFSMSDSTPMILAICTAFGGRLECSPSLLWVSAKRWLASVTTR